MYSYTCRPTDRSSDGPFRISRYYCSLNLYSTIIYICSGNLRHQTVNAGFFSYNKELDFH
jgi:hypothetical protein